MLLIGKTTAEEETEEKGKWEDAVSTRRLDSDARSIRTAMAKGVSSSLWNDEDGSRPHRSKATSERTPCH